MPSSSGPDRTRSRSSWTAVADIPVINGLTLREHPCQALADVFTMHERFGHLKGLVVAFVGDGNNVYHSLALLGAALGMEVRLAHPAGYAPNERIVARAQELAAASGGSLSFGEDPVAAVRGAAVVYTDAWTSMGQEAETEERRDAFAGFTVDDALLDAAGVPMPSRCMACPPTAARNYTVRSWTDRGASSGTSPKIGCTSRRPSWSNCSAEGRDMSDVVTSNTRTRCDAGTSAALRGRLDDAIAAYREAARSRPNRAMPQSGWVASWPAWAGPHEALAAYGAALPRAPPTKRPSAAVRNSWPPWVVGPKQPTPWTAWSRASSATGAWATPPTSGD